MTTKANPVELYEFGAIRVPWIAKKYSDATKELDQAGIQAANADNGPVVAEWLKLKDDLQRVLVGSGENLVATGEAIVKAAAAFGYVDDEHATRLRHSPMGHGIEAPPNKKSIEFVPGGGWIA